MKVNSEIWIPGTELAGDEIIVQYDGRSSFKVNIPNKPHPIGIKVWALANHNFLICWNYHIPGERNGPVHTQVPVELGGSKRTGTGGNKTQAVIAKMVSQLPQRHEDQGDLSPYHVFLDNLF